MSYCLTDFTIDTLLRRVKAGQWSTYDSAGPPTEIPIMAALTQWFVRAYAQHQSGSRDIGLEWRGGRQILLGNDLIYTRFPIGDYSEFNFTKKNLKFKQTLSLSLKCFRSQKTFHSIIFSNVFISPRGGCGLITHPPSSTTPPVHHRTQTCSIIACGEPESPTVGSSNSLPSFSP